MNKIVKGSLALLAALCVGNMTASAKTMTATDLSDLAIVKAGTVEKSQNLYIYGKYVYVNDFSSADLQEATDDLFNDTEYVKEYRKLFADGKAAAIYKDSNNNWFNAKNNTRMTTSVSIEMTQLIGDVSGDHIATDESVYDDTYVKSQELLDGRTAEIFVDTKADLVIANIEKATGNIELASNIAKEYNTYNAGAATVEFNASKDTLKLTEVTPLLKYANSKAGSDEHKWIPVIIKTNKAITRNDTLKIDGGTNLATSIVSTGNQNEYLIWVSEDTKNITIKEKSTSTDTKKEQIITLEGYSKPNVAFENEVKIPEDKSNEVEVLTTDKDIKVATATVNGNYINIFYTNDKTVKRVEFTVNGDKKVATRERTGISLVEDNDWNIIDLLQLNSVKPVASSADSSTSDAVFNKNAISKDIEIQEHTSTKDEPYDYVVYVTHNKEFKGTSKNVTLLVDLSVSGLQPTNAGSQSANFKNNQNSKTYGAKTATEYAYTLTDDADTTNDIVTFSNGANTMGVKFVLVNETPELNLSVEKGNSEALIYTADLDGPKAGANQAYKNIMERVKLLGPEKTDDDKYNVTLQQVDREKGLVAYGDKSLTDHFPTSQKWIAVVVDLGINPTKDLLTVDSFVEEDYAKAKADAKLLGASSDTAFVIWLKEASKTYKFTSVETNASIEVTFNVKEMSTTTFKDIDTDNTRVTSVIISPEYTNEVSYNDSTKEFTVNTDTTKFVATTTIRDNGKETTTTHEYTYVKSGAGFKKIRNLELAGAYVIEKDLSTAVGSDEDKEYNSSIIKNIEVDKNVIDVTFNKNLSSTKGDYCILVDLGVGIDSTHVYSHDSTFDDVTPGSTYVATADSKVPATAKNNLIVLCSNHDSSSIDKENGEGQPFKFVNSTITPSSSATSTNTTVDYEIIVKSHVELDATVDTLSEENVETKDVELDTTNDLSQEEINKFANQDGLTTSMKDGKVYIKYTKVFDNNVTTTGAGSAPTGSWFAVLVDLGINPKYLDRDGDTNYKINPEDITDAYRFGAKGTQFVLWLNADPSANDKYKFVEDPATGLRTRTITFKVNPDALTEYDGDYTFTEEEKEMFKNLDLYAEPMTITFVLDDQINEITIDESNIIGRDAQADSLEMKYDKAQYELNQNRLKYSLDITDDTKTLEITPAVKDVLPVSYDLNMLSAYNGEWYAIELDLGRAVSASTNDSDYKTLVLDEIDYEKGQFVLWINVKSEQLSSKTLTITDTYNKTTETLNFNYSKTVE